MKELAPYGSKSFPYKVAPSVKEDWCARRQTGSYKSFPVKMAAKLPSVPLKKTGILAFPQNTGILAFPQNTQKRHRKDCANVQSDLRLCWAHMP